MCNYATNKQNSSTLSEDTRALFSHRILGKPWHQSFPYWGDGGDGADGGIPPTGQKFAY